MDAEKDTLLLRDALEWLTKLHEKLTDEKRMLFPYSDKAAAELRTLEDLSERIRDRIRENLSTKSGGQTAPTFLSDAPRATDPNADQSAPYMSVAILKDLFKPSEGLGNTIFPEENLPPWCSHAFLSVNTEERGRLLTFKFRGEHIARVCWVRA